VPRSARLVSALAAALALTCVAAAPPAAGGSYTVRQCDYAAGNGHHDFVWQWAGNPTIDPYAGSGCGEFGLAARNSGGGAQRTYPSGAYGGWFAYAPAGTVFTHFSGAFGVLAGCCINGMATYAEATQHPDGRGGRSYLFQGNLGNETWGTPSGLAGPVGRSWHSSAGGFDAKRVGFHLQCGPGFSCSQGVYGDLRLRGRSFDFTLRDDTAPTVGDPVGTLVTWTWVRGTRTLSFPAHDVGGGLTTVEAAFDSGWTLQSPSSCTVAGGRYARLQPCPTARAGEWAVDTRNLSDGGHFLELRATDAGGETTRRTFGAYVDNTAPAAPRDAAASGGEGWRAANAFELSWVNPGGQHAPIVGARWRACPAGAPAGSSECVGGTRSGDALRASGRIELPTAGEWEVVAWLEDAAGNGDPAAASAPRRLRYDPDPPLLDILPSDPLASGRVRATASDLSGVADAKVEVRRHGSGDWIGLATTHAGGRVEAEFGEPLRAAGGVFEVRARAVDAAGNATVAHTTRELPAIPPAWIHPPAADPTPFRGEMPPARPAPRRPVDRVRGRARVTMTVRLRVTRRHAERGKGGRRRVRLRDVRRVVTAGGRPVLFRGRVGRPVPRGGKLVEIQAHFRGRWRTISTTRARRGGRWRFRYTFRTSPWPASYRLRARVPVEGGYPFSAGVSRPVRVTVLPDRR
jgi:hypothetical protein